MAEHLIKAGATSNNLYYFLSNLSFKLFILCKKWAQSRRYE